MDIGLLEIGIYTQRHIRVAERRRAAPRDKHVGQIESRRLADRQECALIGREDRIVENKVQIIEVTEVKEEAVSGPNHRPIGSCRPPGEADSRRPVEPIALNQRAAGPSRKSKGLSLIRTRD